MIYLSLYSFMTLGAFAVIGMLRKGGIEGEEIEDFTGLAKPSRSRLSMLVFMASLTGLPLSRASSEILCVHGAVEAD